MQAMIDMSVVFSDRPQIDLRMMCGPRYNSFVPAADRREDPCRFFQRAAARSVLKRIAIDDETEHWDGLE